MEWTPDTVRDSGCELSWGSAANKPGAGGWLLPLARIFFFFGQELKSSSSHMQRRYPVTVNYTRPLKSVLEIYPDLLFLK